MTQNLLRLGGALMLCCSIATTGGCSDNTASGSDIADAGAGDAAVGTGNGGGGDGDARDGDTGPEVAAVVIDVPNGVIEVATFVADDVAPLNALDLVPGCAPLTALPPPDPTTVPVAPFSRDPAPIMLAQPGTIAFNDAPVPTVNLTDYTISVSMNAQTLGDEVDNASCTFEGPDFDVPCTAGAVEVSSKALHSGGELSVRVETEAGEQIQSNALPIRSYVVQAMAMEGAPVQVSLTSWSTTLFFVDDKMCFSGGPPAGFYCYDGATYTRISRVFFPSVSFTHASGEEVLCGASRSADSPYGHDSISCYQNGELCTIATDNVYEGKVTSSGEFILWWKAHTATHAPGKTMAYDGTTLRQVSNTQGTGNPDANFNVQLGSIAGWSMFSAFPGGGGQEFFAYDGTALLQLSTDIGTSDDSVYYAVDDWIALIHPERTIDTYVFDGTEVRRLSASNFPMKGAQWSGRHFILNAATNPWPGSLFEYDGAVIRESFDLELLVPGGRIVRLLRREGEDVYFIAGTDVTASKLYVFDGTSVTRISNTTDRPEIADTLATAFPSVWTRKAASAIEWNGNTYLSLRNASGASKLFAYDGTRMAQVTNTAQNTANDDSVGLIGIFQSMLYFTASDAWGVRRLYRLCDTDTACGAKFSPP